MILDSVLKLGGKVISAIAGDKDEAARLNQALALAAIEQDTALQEAQLDYQKSITDAQASVVIAEAEGKSFLQRNWRPITMLSLTALIGAHWLGFGAPGLTPQEIADLMDLVKIGLTGFVGHSIATNGIKAWQDGEVKKVAMRERERVNGIRDVTK